MQEQDALAYWLKLDSPPNLDSPGVWAFGRMKFYRHRCRNGIFPEIVTCKDGSKALRLAVQAGAYDGPLDDSADRVNDRCELRDPDKLQVGDDVWYGFSIRVPEDFPLVKSRCVVAQVKMPYDLTGNGSPAFALRIDDGRWIATAEHLYERIDESDHRYLSHAIQGRCGHPAALAMDHHNFSEDTDFSSYQIRSVIATEAVGLPRHLLRKDFCLCTTGVELASYDSLPPALGRWTDFILHIRSSGKKDEDGVIELYADGKLIVRAKGEFGYADHPIKEQYFKIGPYRDGIDLWGDGPAVIEVRDVRRGSTPGAVVLPDREARVVQEILSKSMGAGSDLPTEYIDESLSAPKPS